MPCRNPCKLLHPTYIHSLCWSRKRGVKRIWIGSAFPTNESGEVKGSHDLSLVCDVALKAFGPIYTSWPIGLFHFVGFAPLDPI